MKLFVTGKNSTGKSTFINGLFNGRIDTDIDGKSSEIEVYSIGSVTVCDTPGQELNATAHLQWVQQYCSDVDVVLFCVKMNDQLRSEDVQAMLSLTEAFGNGIWSKLVFILTHANQVEPLDPRKVTKEVYYERILSSMTRNINSELKGATQSVELSPSKEGSIPIVPVGHPRNYSLPGCSDWRSAVIDACVAVSGKTLLKEVIEDDSLTVSDHIAIIAPVPPISPYRIQQIGTMMISGISSTYSWLVDSLIRRCITPLRNSPEEEDIEGQN